MDETFFFWIVWGVLCAVLLGAYGTTQSRRKLTQLLAASIACEAVALGAFFFRWIPAELGGETGWTLIAHGYALPTATIALIGVAFAALLCAMRRPACLPYGAITHIAASVTFVAAMIALVPGTIVITFGDVAPIVAALALLIGNVAVLLAWQQQHLKNKKRTRTAPVVILSRTVVAITALVLIVSLAVLDAERRSGAPAVRLVTALPDVQEYVALVVDAGNSTPGVRVAATPTAGEPWYLVQVYEVFPNHTTTFNWYRVDAAMGSVTLFDLTAETP